MRPKERLVIKPYSATIRVDRSSWQVEIFVNYLTLLDDGLATGNAGIYAAMKGKVRLRYRPPKHYTYAIRPYLYPTSASAAERATPRIGSGKSPSATTARAHTPIEIIVGYDTARRPCSVPL